MSFCPFCFENINKSQIILENKYCLFIQREEPILTGSGLIIPREHRENAFELSTDEWIATHELLHQTKALLDEKYHPDGYNLGWNCSKTAGQEIFHAHMHVIPRFKDEPFAGKGIRYWLKQESNKR